MEGGFSTRQAHAVRVDIDVVYDGQANGHFKNREFNFTEKKEVDKYYPQYYHKTDKVIRIQLQISCVFISFPGWATSLC